jgi:hypothetical protein
MLRLPSTARMEKHKQTSRCRRGFAQRMPLSHRIRIRELAQSVVNYFSSDDSTSSDRFALMCDVASRDPHVKRSDIQSSRCSRVPRRNTSWGLGNCVKVLRADDKGDRSCFSKLAFLNWIRSSEHERSARRISPRKPVWRARTSGWSSLAIRQARSRPPFS